MKGNFVFSLILVINLVHISSTSSSSKDNLKFYATGEGCVQTLEKLRDESRNSKKTKESLREAVKIAVLGCNDHTITSDQLREMEKYSRDEGFSQKCAEEIRLVVQQLRELYNFSDSSIDEIIENNLIKEKCI